ncbi:unnamed protein product [Allacma fusca]|uniref:Sulfatase N-terminal domain-containing protein n=1 Tax=Allacma fusca TaxID=39272 RepID=A0A8J2NZR4_9HEXA|nr:unnamed protein product [Allacma fusca]
MFKKSKESFCITPLIIIVFGCFNFSPTDSCCDEANTCSSLQENQRPNIIFILADDAGWNDFSFHGSPQIPTPNIDAIALNGVILNSYYSSPLCTPSRGTTLTGKYAIRLGLQHYVITGGTEEGLPLNEKVLPEYLHDLGYETHLIGKWHLGHARRAYTPTLRGFDSHFGYYLGAQDYYSHLLREQYGAGYDFRSNLTVNHDAFGRYNTDLFTEEAIRLIREKPKDKPLFLMVNHIAPHSSNRYVPLQAPEENVKKFEESIADESRRHYAGLVDKLDESVGLVMKEMAAQKLLDNSIIIFASDNGGAPEGYDLNHGSNWPFRGTKNTLWEGGTRLAACIWSPLLRPHVHESQMHAADWLPTLVEAAEGDTSVLEDMDGFSQWKSLQGLESPPRNAFLYNIDDVYNSSAVRYGKWKLIQGNTSSSDLGGCPNGSCDGWYGPSGRSQDTGTSNLQMPDLLPLILNSDAGSAFRTSGFPINEEIAKKNQKFANVECKPVQEIACNAFQAPCLFNLDEDPCEKRNLAEKEPVVVEFLQEVIQDYNKTALPPIRRWNNPESAPSNWGYVWTFFKDLQDENVVTAND